MDRVLVARCDMGLGYRNGVRRANHTFFTIRVGDV
jgi:hypothetical protein